MLTEIEWWGGLLFIWLGFCYVMMLKEFNDEPRAGVGFLSLQGAYLGVGILLAMYFYALDTPLLQNMYLGTLVAAAIFNLAFAFWPDSESMKAKNAETDDDEYGIGTTIFSWVLFWPPILAVFTLAAYKSLEFQVFVDYLN